ncbi:MAG: DRTGG domain-containing protein [Pseudomonadota bacterium]
MKLRQIVDILSLTVMAGRAGLDTEVTGGYAADLVSCAMAGAQKDGLWVTLQGHLNIVAVASLSDLAAIIVTENKVVEPEALAKANEEGIPILSTPCTTFEVVGRLWEMGVRT